MSISVENKISNDGQHFNHSEKKNTDKIKDLSNQFESLFLGIVLKSMRKSVSESGFVKHSNGEKIFRGMLDQEYSKVLAEQRTTGIADSIERHLLGLTKADVSSVRKQNAILKYSGEQNLFIKER